MASAAWEARNARARALGYENYYDYRVHGYGAKAPSEPKATGEELSRLRGHRGAADLRNALPHAEILTLHPATKDPDTGKFTSATVLVEMDDGDTGEYTLYASLGQLDEDYLDDLYLDMLDYDVEVIDAYELLTG